jgi:type IV secretion system protein VirB9
MTRRTASRSRPCDLPPGQGRGQLSAAALAFSLLMVNVAPTAMAQTAGAALSNRPAPASGTSGGASAPAASSQYTPKAAASPENKPNTTSRTATKPTAASPSAQPQAPTTPNRTPDPRVQQLATDGEAVIELAVQRGQLTHIVLPPGENFVLPPATGQGARCDDETHVWCVVAQGRDVFVKAKPGARTNNLILVTERRRFALDLRAVDRGGVMRLTLLPPSAANPTALPGSASDSAGLSAAGRNPNARAIPVATTPDPQRLLQERMSVVPMPRNANYSMAVGKASDDIAPSMVFDDGRFTYFRFAGNRPLPVVFQTGADGGEESVNVRMGEDDLLVADRVARRFVLRLGTAVVVLVNDGFDLEGQPPVDGTTVPGVTRALTQSSGRNGAGADRRTGTRAGPQTGPSSNTTVSAPARPSAQKPSSPTTSPSSSPPTLLPSAPPGSASPAVTAVTATGGATAAEVAP